jgi:hypothetical protein
MRRARRWRWLLTSRAMRTGAVSSWLHQHQSPWMSDKQRSKHYLHVCDLWTGSVKVWSGSVLCTLNCWILRGIPISNWRTALSTLSVLHISWNRSRWNFLPKPGQIIISGCSQHAKLACYCTSPHLVWSAEYGNRDTYPHVNWTLKIRNKKWKPAKGSSIGCSSQKSALLCNIILLTCCIYAIFHSIR